MKNKKESMKYKHLVVDVSDVLLHNIVVVVVAPSHRIVRGVVVLELLQIGPTSKSSDQEDFEDTGGHCEVRWFRMESSFMPAVQGHRVGPAGFQYLTENVMLIVGAEETQ